MNICTDLFLINRVLILLTMCHLEKNAFYKCLFKHISGRQKAHLTPDSKHIKTYLRVRLNMPTTLTEVYYCQSR